MLKLAGANNDIDVSKLSIAGDSTAYTLTTSSVDITSDTSFTISLNGTDRTALSSRINKDGTSSIDGVPYNLAAAEDWATGAEAAATVADLTGNGITATVSPAPAPPTPPSPSPSPTPPAPAPTTVDGMTIVTTTNTNPDNSTTTTTTVSPVPKNRQESSGDPNRADIPAAKDSDGNPLISVGLPENAGMAVESTDGGGLTLRQKLVNAARPRIEGAEFTTILNKGINKYVPSVTDQNDVTVRTVTVNVAPGTTQLEPITISGTTGTGEKDPAHPNRQEALVIDVRNLPPGTKLILDKVEFAIIIGPSKTIGGQGNNFVFGNGSSQEIILGEGDDSLFGGAGDDIVGSKSGNDFISGDEGNDWLVGGTGNDTLDGGDGNDILQGGASDAGVWNIKQTSDGQMQVTFTPKDTELADSTGFSATGTWTNDHGAGLITDDRFNFIYTNNQASSDIALLVHALLGRLPTLAELSSITHAGYTVPQLAQMAHDYYVKTSGPHTQALETQLSTLINKIWGAGSSTNELVTLGVNHLNGGGSWGSVWLALAKAPQHTATLTDAQGNLSIVAHANLSETGWSLNAGDNSLEGGAGNDVLIGGMGNNVLDGGAGVDLAVFFGIAADFEAALVRNATTGTHEMQFRHKLTGAVNTVRDVEYFQFGAQMYAVPAGKPQPADGLFVELSAYLQPTDPLTLQGLSFHTEWML